ncbi:MAG: septal ring lytic transglycosylase RlpA family protein [Candidatus Bipolaricaulaceae bacterium]
MRSEWLLVLVGVGAALAAIAYTAQYDEVGIASWYGPNFHGKTTANGELYDMYAFTAAHKTLPFGTVVEVVDLETGRSVVVRINDRGPFVAGRIIDLSRAAAEALGMVERGITRVGLRVLARP